MNKKIQKAFNSNIKGKINFFTYLLDYMNCKINVFKNNKEDYNLKNVFLDSKLLSNGTILYNSKTCFCDLNIPGFGCFNRNRYFYIGKGLNVELYLMLCYEEKLLDKEMVKIITGNIYNTSINLIYKFYNDLRKKLYSLLEIDKDEYDILFYKIYNCELKEINSNVRDPYENFNSFVNQHILEPFVIFRYIEPGADYNLNPYKCSDSNSIRLFKIKRFDSGVNNTKYIPFIRTIVFPFSNIGSYSYDTNYNFEISSLFPNKYEELSSLESYAPSMKEIVTELVDRNNVLTKNQTLFDNLYPVTLKDINQNNEVFSGITGLEFGNLISNMIVIVKNKENKTIEFIFDINKNSFNPKIVKDYNGLSEVIGVRRTKNSVLENIDISDSDEIKTIDEDIKDYKLKNFNMTTLKNKEIRDSLYSKFKERLIEIYPSYMDTLFKNIRVVFYGSKNELCKIDVFGSITEFLNLFYPGINMKLKRRDQDLLFEIVIQLNDSLPSSISILRSAIYNPIKVMSIKSIEVRESFVRFRSTHKKNELICYSSKSDLLYKELCEGLNHQSFIDFMLDDVIPYLKQEFKESYKKLFLEDSNYLETDKKIKELQKSIRRIKDKYKTVSKIDATDLSGMDNISSMLIEGNYFMNTEINLKSKFVC